VCLGFVLTVSFLPMQRHSFRAKATDIVGDAAGGAFGSAGPARFGPGAVTAPAAEDEQSLTWTSGMASNRQGFGPVAAGFM
jgi:hypothetical protein